MFEVCDDMAASVLWIGYVYVVVAVGYTYGEPLSPNTNVCDSALTNAEKVITINAAFRKYNVSEKCSKSSM